MLSPYTELIDEPNQNDVLCGRGGKINSHTGNVQFRSIVESHKRRYAKASKTGKALISREIIDHIASLNPMGRFLVRSSESNMRWYEARKDQASRKVSQALRERYSGVLFGRQQLSKPSKTVSFNFKAMPKKSHIANNISNKSKDAIKASLDMIERLAAQTRSNCADSVAKSLKAVQEEQQALENEEIEDIEYYASNNPCEVQYLSSLQSSLKDLTRLHSGLKSNTSIAMVNL